MDLFGSPAAMTASEPTLTPATMAPPPTFAPAPTMAGLCFPGSLVRSTSTTPGPRRAPVPTPQSGAM